MNGVLRLIRILGSSLLQATPVGSREWHNRRHQFAQTHRYRIHGNTRSENLLRAVTTCYGTFCKKFLRFFLFGIDKRHTLPYTPVCKVNEIKEIEMHKYTTLAKAEFPTETIMLVRDDEASYSGKEPFFVESYPEDSEFAIRSTRGDLNHALFIFGEIVEKWEAKLAFERSL